MCRGCCGICGTPPCHSALLKTAECSPRQWPAYRTCGMARSAGCVVEEGCGRTQLAARGVWPHAVGSKRDVAARSWQQEAATMPGDNPLTSRHLLADGCMWVVVRKQARMSAVMVGGELLLSTSTSPAHHQHVTSSSGCQILQGASQAAFQAQPAPAQLEDSSTCAEQALTTRSSALRRAAWSQCTRGACHESSQYPALD